MGNGSRSHQGETDAAEHAVGVIARYRPVSLTPAAVALAREVVTAARPGTPARAKALLFAAGRLAVFGEQVGLELDRALFSEAVIERFILVGCPGVSAATRRTLRTNLRSLARALERYPQPLPVALSRERAKAPYSAGEVDGFLRLAGCLSTQPRRMRATALICVGAGAGVIGTELRHLTGRDVVCRSGGVLVQVPGPRARVVPVQARFQQRLLDAAGFAGDGFLLGGRAPERRNLTDTLTGALCQDHGLPRLETGRLRSTWLVACAQQIGLHAFMQAAGITCSQRLGDLTAQLPAVSDSELVAMLGAGT